MYTKEYYISNGKPYFHVCHLQCFSQCHSNPKTNVKSEIHFLTANISFDSFNCLTLSQARVRVCVCRLQFMSPACVCTMTGEIFFLPPVQNYLSRINGVYIYIYKGHMYNPSLKIKPRYKITTEISE